MEHFSVGETRDHFPGGGQIDQHRVTGHQPGDGFGVRRFDLLSDVVGHLCSPLDPYRQRGRGVGRRKSRFPSLARARRLFASVSSIPVTAPASRSYPDE